MPDSSQTTPDTSATAPTLTPPPSLSTPPNLNPNPQPPDLGQALTANVALQPNTAPPQPTPDQVQAHHDGMLGKAARFLLGTQSSYSVDPATGKTVETSVQQTPGQFFRSILAGAILGGAAGSQVKTGSGLQGAAVGAGTALANQFAQNDARKAQAQQDFKNSQEIDDAEQKRIMQSAQIAHMNVQNILAQRQLDLAEQDHIDTLTNRSEDLQDKLMAQPGVQMPPIYGADGKDLNNTTGNGADLMKAYTSDPTVHTAPNGFHRMVLPAQVDLAGLNYDAQKGQWQDGNGNTVDLATRTKNVVVDVPNDVMGKVISPSVKDINAVLGKPVYKDGDTPTLTLGNYLTLVGSANERDSKATELKIKDRQQRSEASLQGAEAAKARAETKKLLQAADPASVQSLSDLAAKGGLTEDMIGNMGGATKTAVQKDLAARYPDLDQTSIFLTAEQRKRADLARNAAENLQRAQAIFQQRPDLLGVVNGRITQGKYLTGTNDADLGTLEASLDAYGLATTGAHGVRAVDARADARKNVSNLFTNGPQATQASISASLASLANLASAGKPRGLDGRPYVLKTGPQTWSLSAWQLANPTGDANAAKAAAAQAGYQVVN